MHYILFAGLLIMVLWLLLLAVAYVYAQEEDVNFQVICSLTNKEPYYDCDELWIIGYVNSLLVTDPTGQSVLGFAVIGEKYIEGDYSICNFYPRTQEIDEKLCHLKWTIVGNNPNDGCYMGICLTPLEHELKHLKCDCNWHKGLEPTKNYVITILGNV